MEEWDKSQSGNLIGNSLVGTCLILPNLGLLRVFFKYPKITNNGNLLFFPVNRVVLQVLLHKLIEYPFIFNQNMFLGVG